MNLMSKIGASFLSAVAMLAISSPAMATNGYFTHGVGAESKGMAGAGIGSNSAKGAIIVASNPALGVFAEDNWEVGLSLFSPMRTYQAGTSFAQGQGGAFTIGEGRYDSSSEWFPIPYIAKNWRMKNGNALTLAFYGRGGMNTDWDSDEFALSAGVCPPPFNGEGPFCSGDAGVDLSQAFLMVNYAGKAGDNFAWGLGPVFAMQAFEAKGLHSFAGFTRTFGNAFPGYFGACLQAGGDMASCQLQAQGQAAQDVTNLTNNSHEFSTGVGAAVGFWWQFTDTVSVGASYQSKIGMSEFDDYSDLFAEQGGFDIPSSAKLGVSFGGNGSARVNFDVEHTQYSEVDSVGNSISNILTCPIVVANFGLPFTPNPEACLGGDVGAGFGWEDMTTYKLGVEWQSGEATTWRCGYSYGEQPIPDSEVLFNILAPGVMEQHFTVGMSKNNWNFSLMFAPNKTIEGVNTFDPTQMIKLEMKQFEFEFSYVFR